MGEAHHEGLRADRSRVAPWLATAFSLAVAALQLALFLPDIAGGRASEVIFYRVDGLGLVFGVTWCLAAAFASWAMANRDGQGRQAAALIGLMTLAALNMVYAREPWLLYIAWEIMGVGLWLMVRAFSRERLAWLAWALHLPGWLLLAPLLLGPVVPFAPPFGGQASAWPAWVGIGLGVAALMRGGAWPFSRWAHLTHGVTGGRVAPMLALYSLTAPFVLAKALIAAPWEPLGGWALALIGTAVLVGTAAVFTLSDSPLPLGLAAICSSAAVTGFGLAPGSPLAALGAVALVLAGMVAILPLAGGDGGRVARLLALAGLLPGAWLIALGVLSQGYGLIAALLLPTLALTIICLTHTTQPPTTRYPLPATILILITAYPQALVWLGLEPAVVAMAGGVGTPGELVKDWGLGLKVEGVGGILLAALPATGIVTALFLVWATLYWLRRILSRFYSGGEYSGPGQYTA